MVEERFIMSNLEGKDKGEIEYKRSIQEEVESLTIHGWPRIVAARSNFSKAIWFALCLASTGFLVYIAIQSLLKHMKYDVIVNTNRNQLSVSKFPAITFCNSNLYSLTNYHNVSPPVNQEFPKSCSITNGIYFKSEMNNLYFKLGCKMFFGNVTKPTSQVGVDIGYKFKFPEHFSLLPHSYPCFTLNKNLEFLQEVGSSKAGIHILIKFDENDRIFNTGEEPSDSIMDDPRNGMYVAIHSPQDFHGDDGIPLSPGFETRISIQKSIIQRKKSPFPSKCLDDNEQQFQNIFPGRPSLDACYSSCYYINLYRKCKYMPSHMKPFMPPDVFPDQQNSPTCSEEEMKGKNLLFNCKCSLPCYKEQYKTDVMQSVWPQEWQAQKYHELLRASSQANESSSININYIRRQLIKVVIYYTDLAEYHYEEKELYDVFTILSDFGGQMGLFIGASLISLVELGALLWHCVKKSLKTEERAVSDSKT